MNKYEAEAFNWEDEYVPDFMPEEGNYNVLVRYAINLVHCYKNSRRW